MKLFKKINLGNWFNKLFGFEHGIDISNETQLLFRRNVVIKNIIFVANIVYTILMMFISLFTPESNGNWILTIILFPLTFLINNTLKKMIYKNKDELIYQQIAMYIAVFYMFFSSILIYMKMKTPFEITNPDGSVESVNYFGETGYILIYFSLVVVSLYQDKKMLKNISRWLLVVITILHFTVTYKLTNSSNFAGDNLFEKLLSFFSSTEFIDIVLRTVILIVFTIVLYIIISIAQYMQEERRKELVKRQEVQDDFTKVVTDMFNITLNQNKISEADAKHIELVSVMSERFAEILGLSLLESDEIRTFARIHIDKKVDMDISQITDKDLQFAHLRNQTSLGNQIVKRLELERKCEDIIRAHEEGFNEESSAANKTKLDEREQIILISDMYISLRSVRSYKRPLPHNISMNLMNNEFSGYYDEYIFERFVRFQDEFEKIYDEF